VAGCRANSSNNPVNHLCVIKYFAYNEAHMRALRTLLILSVTLLLTIASCTPQMTPTPIPPARPTATPIPYVPDTIKGSFRNQIGILEENMPRSKSEGYVVPTDEEQADFAEVVSKIYRNELGAATELLAQNHYTFHYYVDRGDDYAVSYLLREQRPIQKGWGLYAFRVNSTSNIIVEAPHPLYDRRTPSIALDVYRALDARALLIAGAHRNANRDGMADVAHAANSIFQTIHESLPQEVGLLSEDVVILQIHGFHTTKHEGYPQAVLGFGRNTALAESTLAQELEAALTEQGIKVGLCVEDAWRDLCGRTNGQGAVSNGAAFIHIELDELIRKNDEAFVAALVQVFGQ
jgi:hypothetical protein